MLAISAVCKVNNGVTKGWLERHCRIANLHACCDYTYLLQMAISAAKQVVKLSHICVKLNCWAGRNATVAGGFYKKIVVIKVP